MDFTMRAAAALTADLNYAKVRFNNNDAMPANSSKIYIYLLQPGMEPEIGDLLIVPVHTTEIEKFKEAPTHTIKAVTMVDAGKVSDLDISKQLCNPKFVLHCLNLEKYQETEQNLSDLTTDLNKRKNQSTQAQVLASLGITDTKGIPSLGYFIQTEK